MAGISDASARAARIILGIDEAPDRQQPSPEESGESLLNTFYSLAQLTPPAGMPVTVRSRVEDHLARAAAALPSQSAKARSDTKPSALRRLAGRKVRLPMTAAAMICLALLLSIGANVLLARNTGFRPAESVYLSGTGSAPDARGVLLADSERVVLFASGLAELTTGYRYVAWTSDSGTMRRLGTLTALGPNTARLLIPETQLHDVVVVSIEASSSSREPEGPQVLLGLVD